MERFSVKNQNTAHRMLADEALAVNFHSSFFYNLNPVGTFIWERCEGRHTVAQIAGELAEEYDVTLEKATRDCRQFTEGLVKQGLLQWRGEPA